MAGRPRLSENIRLRGVREHFERVDLFLKLAKGQVAPEASFRLLVAAIYSSRAAIELMLESAEKQEIKDLQDKNPKANRKAFCAIFSRHVPYFSLIQRIRIHDFHRFALVPPNPAFREVMLGGPIRLRAQKGVAGVTLSPAGPRTVQTGDSRVRMDRPLVVDDGRVFDDESSKLVGLDEIVEAIHNRSTEIVSFFESSLTYKGTTAPHTSVPQPATSCAEVGAELLAAARMSAFALILLGTRFIRDYTFSDNTNARGM